MEATTTVRRNNATDICVQCGEQFGSDRPCWESYATYDDGTHEDGVCLFCAANAGNVAAIRKLKAQEAEKKYGAFRIVRDGQVLKVGEMNEQEATDLAAEVHGQIEHQNPETGAWKVW